MNSLRSFRCPQSAHAASDTPGAACLEAAARGSRAGRRSQFRRWFIACAAHRHSGVKRPLWNRPKRKMACYRGGGHEDGGHRLHCAGASLQLGRGLERRLHGAVPAVSTVAVEVYLVLRRRAHQSSAKKRSRAPPVRGDARSSAGAHDVGLHAGRAEGCLIGGRCGDQGQRLNRRGHVCAAVLLIRRIVDIVSAGAVRRVVLVRGDETEQREAQGQNVEEARHGGAWGWAEGCVGFSFSPSNRSICPPRSGSERSGRSSEDGGR